MKNIFTIALLLFVFVTAAKAQNKAQSKIDSVKLKASANEQTEKFRKNDTAYRQLTAKNTLEKRKADSTDLKLTSCPFEKDANAMVISDMANIAYGPQRILMERYKRIKIFNDNGKSEANIRIEYDNKFGAEHILAILAETINFNNGKIERTKLDSSLIYNVHTDKERDAVIFTMPNVKAGSVIEYAYIWGRVASRNFPDWNFQCNLPTLYSEVNVLLNPQLVFTQLTVTNQPFVKDTVSFGGYGHLWAMANIPSLKHEPYMRSDADGVQHMSFILKGIKNYYFESERKIADSWETLGKQIMEDKYFIGPYDQNINDGGLVKNTKAFKTEDEKIAFLFNQVKTIMKWNGQKYWLSKDGIKSAWKIKSGNWGEINMILYHLLVQAGIKAYPLLVSTRDNGLIYSDFPNIFQINKTVVYVPVDSTKSYVLDATDKYNLYNEIPYDLLNSQGLLLDKEKTRYKLVLMKREAPVKQFIAIDAEIQPGGTMTGTTIIEDYSYNKSSNIELNKTLDDKKYKEYLTNYDNNIKITSLKFEDADVDSLPLTQTIGFKLDLANNDDKYIYFNPNLFTALRNNPFISSTRTTDIDFGYKNTLSIRGRYKLPAGYKIDFLPKSVSLVMPGKDITLKRLLQEEDGYITVYYVITYKQAIYSKNDYADLYAYFKKMYDMLNEQVVLKKS